MSERPEALQGPGMIMLKLGLLLVSIGASLATGELAVRILDIAPKISRINPEMKQTVFRVSDNPLLGYVYKENYRDEKANLWTSYPYINAHGFRDIERTYEKPQGTKRIVLLGDSVVAGHIYIPTIDETISRQLEKMLSPRKIEVLNMGVTGYCTRGEVELLVERGLRYDPDLVILVFVGNNDYTDLNMELGYVTPSPPVRFLAIHSALFRYLGVKYNFCDLGSIFGVEEVAGKWIGRMNDQNPEKRRIVESDEATSETIRRHLGAMDEARQVPGQSNVHAGVRMLKKLSEEHGFKVIIGVWPHFEKDKILDLELYNVDQNGIKHIPEVGGLTIEKLAAETGIPSFRFSHFFARDHAERVAKAGGKEIANLWEIYVGDPMHPNPDGAAVAARAIETILRENPGLLE